MIASTHYSAYCGLLCLALLSTAHAQGTAFTYQGRLNSGGAPANGSYDIAFALFATNVTGTAVAGAVTNSAVTVSNGLFTTAVDFGPGIFTGSNYWLELAVSTNGANAFSTLAPRQPLNPVPYAIFAESASAAGLTGTIPAADINGNYGNPVNFGNGLNSFDGTFYGLFYGSSFVGGTFVGSGSGLSDVWHTDGNLGTIPALNYLGTADNQPLIIKVNGQEAFRFEPNPNTPNVVGGYSGNSAQPGVYGVTIGGGYLNSASGNYAAIGGGAFNAMGTNDTAAVIAGGYANSMGANSYQAIIGGGYNNLVGNTSPYSAIAGGFQNANQDHAAGSFIGGGNGNVIVGDAKGQNDFGLMNSAIVGGQGNVIQTNSGWSFVGGGYQNTIQPYAREAVIGGGAYNNIQGYSNYWFNDYAICQTIGGGYLNTILAGSVAAVIGGGSFNTIQTNSSDSFVGGGYGNAIDPNASEAMIGGGSGNIIGTNAYYANIGGGYANNNISPFTFIGGGYQNFIAPGNAAVIAGGYQNFIAQNSYEATIAGGWTNQIASNDYQSFIGGGSHNIIQSNSASSTIAAGGFNAIGLNSSYEVIGGGGGNVIGTNANDDTISGGLVNSIGNNLDQAAIAGGNGNIIGDFSRAAFIGGGVANVIGTNSGFSTIAGGNYNFIGNNTAQAFIGGGLANTNTGFAATIPGGSYNLASGILSFAAGNRARATNDGTFVWADWENADFGSTTTNQFNVRASGGVRFVTSGAGMTLDGQPIVSAASVLNSGQLSGAYTNTVTFNNSSDSFTGNGAGLTNVNAATLNGLASSNFWTTTGNAGTTPGVNFIGTSDNQRLLIRGSFVGIGRTNVIGSEVFGVEAPVSAGSFGGMYIDTASANAAPFYGYSQARGITAYHYVDGTDGNKWKLWVGGSIPITALPNGNVGIGNTAPTNPLMMGSGAYCSAAGVWTSVSDRNAKENFTPIAPANVLAKVAALPITQWKYKVEPQGVKHIGPVAQDFHDAFGLGDSDRAIGTIDESGVALAAIQGLNQKVESDNAALRAENAKLKARLEKLERLVSTLAGTTK